MIIREIGFLLLQEFFTQEKKSLRSTLLGVLYKLL